MTDYKRSAIGIVEIKYIKTHNRFYPIIIMYTRLLISILSWQSIVGSVSAFTAIHSATTLRTSESPTQLHATTSVSRRRIVQTIGGAGAFLSLFVPTSPVWAEGKSFAPGGTLVDYEVGVTVGNPQASASRKPDNSNVIFSQDYYYKFGTAAPWIEPGNTEFPKTMPFTPSQQRYDTMKKYRERVQRGIDLIASLGEVIAKGDYATIADSTAPEYSIRPMGLMANNFLASENTGTTNELLLARWYINEINLDIDDIKNASSKDDAVKSHLAAINALNSFLGMLNRVITSKVGDKFDLV